MIVRTNFKNNFLAAIDYYNAIDTELGNQLKEQIKQCVSRAIQKHSCMLYKNISLRNLLHYQRNSKIKQEANIHFKYFTHQQKSSVQKLKKRPFTGVFFFYLALFLCPKILIFCRLFLKNYLVNSFGQKHTPPFQNCFL